MSSLIISTHLYEKRPLKKPKLGPPDVYPQDPKQKEDELTAINVKQGYNNNAMVPEEYGSARSANITSNRFGEYFSAILSKKAELNTLNDTSRKKQQINKDSTLYVTSKTKNYVDNWFKDFASNTKPLNYLSRKVPIFNKKEEIFITLYEFSVPMFKAEWFIKMSSAHHIAMSESNNKSKKRQMPDPSQEWTNFLCKFLKDHYLKVVESLNSNSSNNLQAIHMLSSPVNTEELLKQWNYYIQLAKHLYDNNLLDRQDFLNWLLELLERIKSVEDPMINLILPIIVHYVCEFTNSEALSRRLCYYSAKKINQLVYEFNIDLHAPPESDKENVDRQSNNHSQSNGPAESKSGSTNSTPTKSNESNSSSSALMIKGLWQANPLSTCFKEIVSCSRHRSILFSLSTIIQIVTLECPTSLVWLNNLSNHPDSEFSGKHSNSSSVHGSPLDFLPCEPSNLPMPPSENNGRLRMQIKSAEELIRHRSKLSEKKWFFKFFDSLNTPKAVGSVVNRLLTVLDYLDKHQFDRVSSSNSLDALYTKIFSSISTHIESTSHSSAKINENHSSSSKSDSKSSHELDDMEVFVIKLLCEWAVTTKRLGEHRSRVVAKLLERRQNELMEKELAQNEQMNQISITTNESVKVEPDVNPNTNQKGHAQGTSNNLNGTKIGASTTNQQRDQPTTNATSNIPIFQNILFEFLDVHAPVYDDKTFNLYSTHSFNTNNGNNSTENKQAFSNLILLFSELIRCEVFSHDAYMCTLISRGHFANPPNTALVASSTNNQSSKNNNDDLLAGLVPSLTNIESVSNGGLIGSSIHKSTSSSSLPMFDPLSNNSSLNSNEQSGGNWLSMSNDNVDEDLDDDLDKILQHIKAGQNNSLIDQTDILLPDAMESDKEDDHNGPNSTKNNGNPTSLSDLPGVAKNASHNEHISSTSRHLLYTLHFPLPQDEFFIHECNQRHILLYGVGKTKDEARHSVKKVTKEILKLFNRKSSMDISDGGKVKKHVIKEGFNFESATSKFRNLSIFDQQVVTNSCASTVLEMINGVVVGNANHLPLIESIAFLFDLMEIALNVHGLIEFIVQILKELVEVESQLQKKCSILARPYCTSIGLYMVGVLYRYHNFMVVSNDDIASIFDGLWKLVRPVTTPSDCSSAERCIFYYIYDLYSSCSHLLKKYHESIGPTINKIKAMGTTQNESNNIGSSTNSCNMMEYLKNPKLKVDSTHIRQLNENASDRYSLVYNAICCIAETNDMDHLNEMSVLCAELTASCLQLTNEWFNAFKILFNSNRTNEYSSLLSHINIGDRAIYDNLAIFTLILVARRCFSLDEFIPQVFIPSLLTPVIPGLPSNSIQPEDAERCARLACHLLLYLFKYYDSPLAISSSAMNSSFASSSRYSLTSPGPLGLPATAPPNTGGQKPSFVIKYACDRYLLGGALNSLRIEIIVTVLKSIYMLGDRVDKKSDKSELNFNEILKPIANDDDFGDIGLLSTMSSKSKIDSMDKPSLCDFSKYVLRQICSQDWIHDRFLRGYINNTDLMNKLLFDKRFISNAQNLVNMICHHKQMNLLNNHVNEKSDPKQIIQRVFHNIDEWSIRISWVQLNLIYEQLLQQQQNNTQPSNLNDILPEKWLDNIARAVVDYYQSSSQNDPILDCKQLTLFTSKSSTVKSNIPSSLNFVGNNSTQQNNERIWLVTSLITRLPSVLQSKILRVAANVFDSSHWIVFVQTTSSSINSKSKSSFQGSKNNSSNGVMINSQNLTSDLLSYQPFIALILKCLGSKDDHKEATNVFLNSIYIQISQCINEKLSENIRVKHSIQNGLKLRFSLVGAMFDVIQTSNHTPSFNDFSILFLQLIIFSIVDPHIDYENFTTVLDMLTSLMHTTQLNVLPEQREETKKQHQNLIKKLKKELNIERVSVGIRMAKQLLPMAKLQTEVIACEPMGSLVDTKGNKIAGFDSIDKKQGLQVAEKQKLSPWDLLEGSKNPAPLSWTWFGAIRIERKPMRTEENFYLLARHNHSIRKSTSYYIEPPPLPPEDEPAPPPPPPLITQTPIQTPLPFANPQMGPNNGPNMNMQSSPHISNLPQGPPFNATNIGHTMPVPQHPNANSITNNFHASHMHSHMPPMSGKVLPHSINQGPPVPGPMHGGNLPPSAQPQPPHHMGGPTNDHQLGQPNHHMMMNTHMTNNSMTMPMSLDNHDLMMDTLPPPNTGPMHPTPMQSAPMVPIRPTMNPVPPVALNPVGMGVGPRAQATKVTKPKAPRKRRVNAKNQQALSGPASVAGQQTPPIRMGNSFEGFPQTSTNNPMASQPMGQGNNSWQYQQQVGGQPAPNQPNMANQPNPNTPNQGFYQQTVTTGPNSGGPPNMMPPQAQQARFNEHPIPSQSKERLRAMLNTRQPNTNQFNLPPNTTPTAGPTAAVNSNPMLGQNNTNMISGGMYQARQQMPMMQARPPMRAQGPVSQPNQTMAPISNQNPMFQQQQQQMNPGVGNQMVHHRQQPQQSNFAGPPNMNFNNNTVPPMDNSGMQQIGNSGPGGFPAQQTPQPNMMLRPQMQMAGSQQMVQQPNQTQFMQRAQYNNGPMGQHTFAMQQQQQQQQHAPNQQMMNRAPHWQSGQSEFNRW